MKTGSRVAHLGRVEIVDGDTEYSVGTIVSDEFRYFTIGGYERFCRPVLWDTKSDNETFGPAPVWVDSVYLTPEDWR